MNWEKLFDGVLSRLGKANVPQASTDARIPRPTLTLDDRHVCRDMGDMPLAKDFMYARMDACITLCFRFHRHPVQ